MDIRIFLTTFAAIFLAEMGDKTQLAAMTLAAQGREPWAFWLGAALALACVSAIAVVLGSTLAHVLPMEWIKRGAGGIFIVIGALMLADRM